MIVGLLFWAMQMSPAWAQLSVSFSHDGGICEKPVLLSLELSNNIDDQEAIIRYTLNGNSPDGHSSLYRKPILLDSRCLSSSALYRIQNAPDEHWFCPDRVERIVVVRAAAFDRAGNRVSNVETRSYVVESLLGRKIRMPVVSLCVDSSSLFDYQSGIFIPGASFDPENPETTGNYYLSGRDAEKIAHVEFIDGDEVIAQTCGLRTHGNIGRRYAQKGLSLYARNEYGKKNFKGVLSMEKDKRLVLRPFSNAWTSAGIQDYFCQQIASGLHFDALFCKPVVLFLNGEYWGIYYLEQKPDEKFVAKRHGFDPDSVRLVRDWAGHTKEGFDSGFVAMMRWLETADLTDPKQYAKISEIIDLESFTDYVLFETFIGNRDWPANNMRCWSAEGTPWRFIFFDGDAVRTTKFNAVENALRNDPAQLYPASPESTLLLRKLLENKDFKEKFLTRMSELYEKAFRWSDLSDMDVDMASVFGVVVNELEPEIAYQSARFSNPKDVKSWKKAVKNLRKYFKHRAIRVEREWERALNVNPCSRFVKPILFLSVVAFIFTLLAVFIRSRRKTNQ